MDSPTSANISGGGDTSRSNCWICACSEAVPVFQGNLEENGYSACCLLSTVIDSLKVEHICGFSLSSFPASTKAYGTLNCFLTINIFNS